MRTIALRFWILVLGVGLSHLSFAAVIEKGEFVPNRCWTTVDDKPFCLDYALDTVRVLIHSAGWCGPCNIEMSELASRVKEFEGKPVTFINLAVQGWAHGSMPTKEFMTQWKEKHKIPFTVAASPKDAGTAYFTPPLYVPSVVIIDRNGVLVYKNSGDEVDTVFAEINAALSQR